MKRLVPWLLLSWLACAVLTAVQAAERVEQWTGRDLAEFRLSTFRGQVTVEAAEDDILRVEVRAVASVADPERAAAQLQDIRMTWATLGNWATLDVSAPRETGARFAWQAKDPLTLEIRVALPALKNLQIDSSDGAVRIGRITAAVNVEARRGQVTSALVEGNLFVRVEEGGIVASRVTGDADLRSEFGNVSAGTVGGRARLFARNGDIELLAAKCGIDAESDGGNVAVSITPALWQGSRIESAGGNVTLKIDPSARINLDASTSWGKIRDRSSVRTPLTLEILSGGLGGKRLGARLNYGGAEVQAHASGGDIDLVGAESLF